jgi:hypothetical protein
MKKYRAVAVSILAIASVITGCSSSSSTSSTTAPTTATTVASDSPDPSTIALSQRDFAARGYTPDTSSTGTQQVSGGSGYQTTYKGSAGTDFSVVTSGVKAVTSQSAATALYQSDLQKIEAQPQATKVASGTGLNLSSDAVMYSFKAQTLQYEILWTESDLVSDLDVAVTTPLTTGGPAYTKLLNLASSVDAKARTASDAAPTASCATTLKNFVTAATAGTYTSVAQTITFPTPVTLTNPSSPGGITASQTISVPFSIYGADGSPVTPSASSPVTVSIYGAPGGSIQTTPAGSGTAPVVVSVSSGSAISIKYDGTYLSRPITVIASARLTTTNVCTGTEAYAIGSTTLQLGAHPAALGTVSYSTPTNCRSGSPGTACATKNVDSDGLGLSAAAGYGATVPGAPTSTSSNSPRFSNYTVDTGSIGTALPLSDIGPDAVGPGAPALKYYDSSGNEFVGFTYLAPITFQMGSVKAETDPIRFLAVSTSACHPGKPCKKPPTFHDFHYLGVGFDRSMPSTADPFQSPRDNALLSIAQGSGGTMSQGYILSGSTITAGITSSNSTGASNVGLTTNSTYPGDWNGTPMCITFPTSSDKSPAATCGTMLMDVGIPEMFITFATKGDEPAAVANGLTADQMIYIYAPDSSSSGFSYHFSSGPAGGKTPPTTGLNPSSIGLSAQPSSSGAKVFVNTGRHVLFEYQYVFNAQTGSVGFIPLSPKLR